MWVFPLLATCVALAFAGLLGRQWLQRRRPYQALWAIALVMYSGASAALLLGVLGGWTTTEYRAYWLLGAVLNVPYLALGEVYLLVKRRAVADGLFLAVLFLTAFAVNRVRIASLDVSALSSDLPKGSELFARDTFVPSLARWYSITAYVVLLAGTLWSAWSMRGNRDVRDRFLGTLGIAIGATIVAAGSAFAAVGSLPGFSITITVGIAAMFWGFLRASRPRPRAPTDP